MTESRSSRTLGSRFASPSIIAGVFIVLGAVSFTLRGVDILSLVAAATTTLTQAPATLYLTAYDDLDIYPGDSKKIDVSINARTPINAAGATIKFPQDSIEILGFTKEKSFFDLWTEETSINEETGEIHFSGGTTKQGGMIGTGTVLTLLVRAKKAGDQNLFFKDSSVYANDGKGTQLDNDARAIFLHVIARPMPPTPLQTSPSPSTIASISEPERPLPKSADLNGDGLVNIIDMSIMIIHMMMVPYDQRFDLNMDGSVNFPDLSILLSQVR
jgi:hypothetical protein